MRASLVVGFAFAGLVVFAGASCKKKGAVIGSCDRRTTADDKKVAFQACEDITDKSSLEACSANKSATPCDHAGAIAGCKVSDSSIQWYFPSVKVKSVGHVKTNCLVTLVGPDGAELTGVTPVPLPTDIELEAADLIPHYQPKIEPMLSMVDQIAKKLPAPSKKKLTSPTPLGDARSDAWVHVEDLASLGTFAKLPHRHGGSGEIPFCAQVLRKNDLTDIKSVSDTLSRCNDEKFLIVLRTASIMEPVVTGGNSYAGGRANGDLLVFDLSNGKLVATSPWDATSSHDVDTKASTFEHDIAADFDKQLDSSQSVAAHKVMGR